MSSALEAGYPSDRHHKLHERRARCHLALGRPERAAAALGRYRTALQTLRLAPANRGQPGTAHRTAPPQLTATAQQAPTAVRSQNGDPEVVGVVNLFD